MARASTPDVLLPPDDVGRTMVHEPALGARPKWPMKKKEQPDEAEEEPKPEEPTRPPVNWGKVLSLLNVCLFGVLVFGIVYTVQTYNIAHSVCASRNTAIDSFEGQIS